MQEKTSRTAKKLMSLPSIAGLLIATSFLGQLLGFVRLRLVNANFPPVGPQGTDAYFAAFQIPDFFFFTLAAGALGVAFIPVLADHLHTGNRKRAWELSNSLLNLLAIVMFFVGLFIFIFAKPLITHIVAVDTKLTPEQLNNAVTIMRFVAFNPLLFTISGILTSMQQSIGRFFFYAIAPLFYNVAIIVSIFVFKHNIGLVGLGIGAMIGGVLQLLIVLFGLAGANFHWRPKISWKDKDFKVILWNLPPRSLDQGIDQLNSLVETNFAGRIGQGSITYYNNAFAVSTAPSILIGTAISTAAFPRLTARLAQGRPDLFRKDFLETLRTMIWIILPVVVVVFFARGYLARLAFARGAPEIANILGYLSMAIFFRTIYTLISRWFYAQKDTRTPLLVSVFTIGLNIFLAYFLTRRASYGVEGLALAQSIVAMVEVVILFSIMSFRDRKLLRELGFWSGLWRIVSVTGFSVLAAFIMISLYPLGLQDRGFLTLGSKLAAITFVTGVVHIGVSALFGIDEVKPFFQFLKKIILKPIKTF